MPEQKKIQKIIAPREKHWVGDGFHVSTIFSMHSEDVDSISPFLLMDHAAPRYFPPTQQKLGVGEHPHRGFETVTFAIKGEVEHRDSGGGGGTITTGGIQWMTAGSGVVHDEFHSREFSEKGGDFEMIQLWVNLPSKFKMTPPRYQSFAEADFPVHGLENQESRLRSLPEVLNRSPPRSKPFLRSTFTKSMGLPNPSWNFHSRRAAIPWFFNSPGIPPSATKPLTRGTSPSSKDQVIP